MNCIQFNSESGKFEYKGRFIDFSDDVKQKYPSSREDNTAICHRVSFKLMANALINAANYYIVNYRSDDKQFLAKKTTDCILGIIMAVTGKFPNPLKNPEDSINNFLNLKDDKIENYQLYVKGLMDVLANPQKNNLNEISDVIPIVEGYLNWILEDLNNEEFNLKLRTASWNSSIRDAFDCFNVGTTKKEDGRVIFTLGEEDSKVMTILLNMTMSGGENFDESGVFIFTALLNKENPVLCQSSIEGKVSRDQRKTPNGSIRYWDGFKRSYAWLESEKDNPIAQRRKTKTSKTQIAARKSLRSITCSKTPKANSTKGKRSQTKKAVSEKRRNGMVAKRGTGKQRSL